MLENGLLVSNQDTYKTYEGASGTLHNTINGEMFIEDWPVNLIKVNGSSQTINGVTFTVDKEKGTITANGTATTDTFYQGQYEGVIVDMTSILEDEPLFFSGCPVGGGGDTYFLRIYTQNNSHKNEFGDGVVVTNPRGFVEIKINEGYTCNNLVFKPMLVKGSQPRGFIPYGGGIIKTTGKNLFNGKMEIGYINLTTGEKEENEYRYRSVDFIKVNPNTTYTISRTRGSNRRIIGYDNNLNIITDSVATGRDTNGVLAVFGASDLTYTFTTSPTTQYIRWADTWRATNPNAADYTEDHTQIELGSVATEYEEGASIKLTPNMSKPVAGLKTFGGVTNIISDFDVKLIYAKRQDKYMEALLMNKVEIAPNAGAHNSVYRGKFLGNSVTEAQYAAIRSGRFDDLYIGDYWTIGGVNYRIAHFDYYLNCGDTATTAHHVVIVPDTIFYSAKMNDTNTTEGGYVGSKMYTEGLTQAKNTIKSAFSGHVLSHKILLTNAVSNGHASAGAWTVSEVDLMNECMVYGGYIMTTMNDGVTIPYIYTVEKSQLALFAHNPSFIAIRAYYWLRDVVSAAPFAGVNSYGFATCDNASLSFGVRPAFCIS